MYANYVNTHTKEMRDRVTSKGGTTEAAFKVFRSKKVGSAIKAAIKAAAAKSKKLSKG